MSKSKPLVNDAQTWRSFTKAEHWLNKSDEWERIVGTIDKSAGSIFTAICEFGQYALIETEQSNIAFIAGSGLKQITNYELRITN